MPVPRTLVCRDGRAVRSSPAMEVSTGRLPVRQSVNAAFAARAGYNDGLAMVRAGIALVVAVVALAGPVHAQSDAARAEAKRHFDQGIRLYNVQSYDEAIVEFKAGYQIDPRPEFLYALGQAQRMNHQCKAAIVSYEAFLRTSPAAKQEEAARRQIDVCRTELAAAPAAAAGQPTPPPASDRADAVAPPPASAAAASISEPAVPSAVTPAAPDSRGQAAPVYRRWWFWTLVGGIAAGLAIAAWAGAFTRTMEPQCPTGRYCP